MSPIPKQFNGVYLFLGRDVPGGFIREKPSNVICLVAPSPRRVASRQSAGG